MKVFAKVLFFSVPMLVVFLATLTVHYLQKPVVNEPPTNLLIEAAEQNEDCKIAEIEELLDDRWLNRGHRFTCCYALPYRCIDCGISESEYEEQQSKAELAMYSAKGFGLAPTIIENLIRNISDLIWERLLFPYANIFVATASCLFILIVVRKARSKSLKRISTATLGLALGVSVFIIGLILGPFFACPTLELVRTKVWLQERFPVLSPNSGYY